MSDVRVPEVYSGVTNICKRPKNFDFPGTVQSFRFFGLKSFHGFVILDGTMESLAYLEFYLVIKMWEAPVWKIFTKKHIKHGQEQ